MKNCSLWVILCLLIVGLPSLQGRDVVLSVDNPAAAVMASNKANDLEKKGDLDGAIRYYSAAIRVDPTMYVAIYSRGTIYMQQHKWDLAMADFNRALTVSPSFLLGAIKRAQLNQSLGHYDLALAELTHIIDLRPRIHANALAHSSRAWIYATCPEPAFRNGKQAVADANLACKIDSWDNWDYIDTLAAAYAETGDFEKAIKFENKAMHKTRDADTVKGLQERLALYQQHQPFRLASAR
jgi:tetratricopeptide (TPR) repeat protein